MPGLRVGRYIVNEYVSAGGMGVVYKALDPKLNRTVALKLVRVSQSPDSTSRHRARLLREAQALAKLAHPNVVAVHDVGVVDDDVFIAMEYVEGLTLRHWLRDDSHGLEERVEVLLAAGDGLAAAHQAGLLHRDFKPDNIIIGDDGRVRVIDFGLVRAAAGFQSDADDTTQPNPDESSTVVSNLSDTLTNAGSVVGTPAYMAPEQLRGDATDERTDQFSYCITLHEAVYGKHPFPGLRTGEAYERVVLPPSHEVAVPKTIRRVLTRGLSLAPEDRFENMQALLMELRDRRRGWPLSVLAAASVAAVAAVVAVGVTQSSEDKGVTCTGAVDKLEDVWSGEVKQRMRTAFESSGRSYAAEIFSRVVAVLDVYATRWSAMHLDACEDTHVRGEQSPQLLDLRMHCIDRRLAKMRALIAVLTGDPDGGVVDRAPQAVFELQGIGECEDTASLSERVPPPANPHVRQRVTDLRQRVDRAEALLRSGKYAAGVVLAAAAVEPAKQLDYDPLYAQALYILAELQAESGKHDDAVTTLQAAARVAADARDDVLVAKVWNRLLFVVGYKQADHKRAAQWAVVADQAVRRADDRPELRASLTSVHGALLARQGKFAEAQKLFEETLEHAARAYEHGHPKLAGYEHNLGGSHHAQGHFAQAAVHYNRALEMWQRSFGPNHPKVGFSHNNIGSLALSQGHYAEARKHYTHTLAVWGASLGEQHPNLAHPLNNLANVLRRTEQCDKALDYSKRALAIWETTLGAKHPLVALPLTVLAHCEVTTGSPARGAAYAKRAVAIRTATPGDEVELGDAKFALARARLRVGQRTASISIARSARVSLASSPARAKEDIQAVDRWLAMARQRR